MVMMVKLYYTIVICSLVFIIGTDAMGGPGFMAKGKKCPIVWEFPKPCIDLQPPEDVSNAIQKCWNQAIDIDFKCQEIEVFFRERFSKKKGKKKRPFSPADFIFISSFHWLVYFTDDISPKLCPLMSAETREKIKSTFRNCFLEETSVEMGKMVNVRQVISKLGTYSGHVSNITTVVGIADLCSSKTTNQDDLAKCVTSNLLGACMRDPYYKKPFSHRYSHKGGSKPSMKKGGGGYGNYPKDKAAGSRPGPDGAGSRPGPDSKLPQGKMGQRPKKKGHYCEPCFPLQSSEELKAAFTTCMDTVKPADFYTKFLRCTKFDEKKAAKKNMWLQLFTPNYDISVFFSKKSQDAHTNCMYQKLGLGTTSAVSIRGFKDLVLNHLEGDVNVQEQVIEAIDGCSYTKEGILITTEEFTKCTAELLQKECDMEYRW